MITFLLTVLDHFPYTRLPLTILYARTLALSSLEIENWTDVEQPFCKNGGNLYQLPGTPYAGSERSYFYT